MLQFNPQLLADGLAQGKTLSDIGNASTYNDFIIRNLRGKVRDNYGIDLGAPIQEEMQKQFDGKKVYYLAILKDKVEKDCMQDLHMHLLMIF